jgi:hypothetical protein
LATADNAPAQLVCLAEFGGQYQAFAAGIQDDLHITEIVIPGFSETTMPPPTVEHAAQAIIDALGTFPTKRRLVIVGQGITCIPAVHVIKLLSTSIESNGTKPPRPALVLIAPITGTDAGTIGADPIQVQCLSSHVHNERNLIAYGRYLRLWMQSPAIPDDYRALTIEPRTGSHIVTPVSPLVLEPALTALRVSNWIDES